MSEIKGDLMRVESIRRRLSDKTEVAEVLVEGDYCTIHFDCPSPEHASRLQDAIQQFATDVSAQVED